MRDIREFRLADLLVDQANYRLLPQPSQRDAIRAMIVDQGRKLTVLARDILEFGLSPGELLLVSESPDQPGRFVVYEGNRRITALKVMETPDLAAGLPTEAVFRQLGDRFKANPRRTVDASVVADRETAMFWIQRRHTRGHEGAGVEDWNPFAQDRYDRDHDKPARRSIMAMDLLDDGSPEWKRVEARLEGRTTSVDRVLDMPYFESTLGVRFDTVAVEIHYENGDRAAGDLLLRRVLTAMADPLFKFEQIEKVEDRQQFIESFAPWAVKAAAASEGQGAGSAGTSGAGTAGSPAGQGSDQGTAGQGSGGRGAESQGSSGQGGSGQQGTDTAAGGQGSGSGQGRNRDPLVRDTLAPSRSPYLLSVAGLRLTKLYDECKAIKVDRQRNAAAVLMRVFLELSTDHFIAQRKLPVPAGAAKGGKAWKDMHLQQKVEAVVRELDPKGIDKGLDAARSAGSDFLHGFKTLHRYIHGVDYMPDPTELKDTWVRWHPYLDRLHATLNPK